MDNLPLWRSLLFVPANVEKFVAKAHTRGADAIILDLEDSVVLPEKAAARDVVPQAAETVAGHGLDVLVRINRPWRLAVRDLETSVCPQVHTIAVPKVASADHIRFLTEVIDEIEVEKHMTHGHTRLMALIEGVEGLRNIDEIAAASPRMMGMFVGAEDFSSEAGMEPIEEGLFYVNQQLVFAARRAGILPFGFIGSIADYADLDDFRRKIRLARQLGFVGAPGIHPSQIAIMNEEFQPSADEVEHATGLLDVYEQAVAEGRGAAEFKGKMIDAPIVARAREVLAKHQAVKAKPN
ncbi:MAG TPA: CoA ester lyase [Porticoccaceae bacterium]|nr:CoA ester lyase [Porticoccaceae bacterium]